MKRQNGQDRLARALENERQLIGYAARIVGDWDKAKDIVQETFLKVLTESDAVDSYLRRWLFVVCRNLAIDHCRKEKKFVPEDRAREGPAEWNCPPPLQAAMAKEEHVQVWECLEEMSPQRQEVVRLRLGAGLSYTEIAEVTGLTVSNVGFILCSALKEIREKLSEPQANAVRKRGAK